MNTTIKSDHVLPQDILEAILLSIKPEPGIEPRLSSLAGGLRSRLRPERPMNLNELGIATIREDNGWQPYADGVDMKILFDDGQTQTWLARFSPNASLPAHDHEGYEECFVMSGTAHIGETFMRTGDYQVAGPGTKHGLVRSETGCVLFVRSPSPCPEGAH